jgi:hypothetical protein
LTICIEKERLAATNQATNIETLAKQIMMVDDKVLFEE